MNADTKADELLKELDSHSNRPEVHDAAATIRQLQSDLNARAVVSVAQENTIDGLRRELGEANSECAVRNDEVTGLMGQLEAATNPLGCIHSTFTPNCLGCANRDLARARELLEAANKGILNLAVAYLEARQALLFCYEKLQPFQPFEDWVNMLGKERDTLQEAMERERKARESAERDIILQRNGYTGVVDAAESRLAKCFEETRERCEQLCYEERDKADAKLPDTHGGTENIEHLMGQGWMANLLGKKIRALESAAPCEWPSGKGDWNKPVAAADLIPGLERAAEICDEYFGGMSLLIRDEIERIKS